MPNLPVILPIEINVVHHDVGEVNPIEFVQLAEPEKVTRKGWLLQQ